MMPAPLPTPEPPALLVDTPLGQLAVDPPPMAHPDAGAGVYASAVRLFARDATIAVGRAPAPLRPNVRMLARAWAGDRTARRCVRALDAGDPGALALCQAEVPDMRDCSPQTQVLAHDAVADGLRRAQTLLATTAQLLAAGRTADAEARLREAWAARLGASASGGTAVLTSVGAFRAHTGCVCPGLLAGQPCTCGACGTP